MTESVISCLKGQVQERIWVISDLQQQEVQRAEECLDQAVNDFLKLCMHCSRIWYLGDAVEGVDIDSLVAMTEMQIGVFRALNIPVRFVLGNHDFDLFRLGQKNTQPVILPFYESILRNELWETAESLSDFYFTEEMEKIVAVFLPDHADSAGAWFTSHGRVEGDKSRYPFSKMDYLNFESNDS